MLKIRKKKIKWKYERVSCLKVTLETQERVTIVLFLESKLHMHLASS